MSNMHTEEVLGPWHQELKRKGWTQVCLCLGDVVVGTLRCLSCRKGGPAQQAQSLDGLSLSPCLWLLRVGPSD